MKFTMGQSYYKTKAIYCCYTAIKIAHIVVTWEKYSTDFASSFIFAGVVCILFCISVGVRRLVHTECACVLRSDRVGHIGRRKAIRRNISLMFMMAENWPHNHYTSMVFFTSFVNDLLGSVKRGCNLQMLLNKILEWVVADVTKVEYRRPNKAGSWKSKCGKCRWPLNDGMYLFWCHIWCCSVIAPLP